MRLLTTVFATSVLMLLAGCSRSSTDTTQDALQRASANLSISSIKPIHGPNGTIDTITGVGFSSDPILDTVFFNGRQGIIVSASPNQLIVTVPKLCGTGPVSVAFSGSAASGPTFTYDTTLVVSTVAGSGIAGKQDGAAASASFSRPTGLAVDSSFNVYVADSYNNTIRKISSSGVVSTLAGTAGTSGYINNPSTPTLLGNAHGMCMDALGNLYVANAVLIHKILPGGTVSIYAGTGVFGYLDGPAGTAKFAEANGLCIDAASNIYVADYLNRRVRKISAAGIVSTVAGTGVFGVADGPISSATFFEITGVAITPTGTIYVVDAGAHIIRKISNGIVSTVAGSSTTTGSSDGIGTAALFEFPQGCTLDKSGNLYVTDFNNNSIRRITPDGVVKRFAGAGTGSVDGPITSATFRGPYEIAMDRLGNFYVSDWWNNKIRKISIE